MRYGVPRLVNGLVRDLFQEDGPAYYQDFLAYDVPELESLETDFAWVERLAAKALTDARDFAEMFQRELAAGRASKGKKLARIPDRSRGNREVASSRSRRGRSP
jgi:hypothetical protein